ncbi:MAG TPA: heavy metal-binding domain-containing protein [Candidatus Aphodovivens avistercoris]|nr:heavy metal-binding domain-containing protein [Candidatus Aphodovivens avistercoris]
MIVTTTQSVEGYRVTGYYGIVFGEVITGINFLKDFGAGIRNLVGGRSKGYEDELLQARTEALAELEQRAAELGAHAVVGVDMDYEVLGQGNMLMVTASGTAVTLAQA